MIDFLRHLLDSSGFPPRWRCGSWTPSHGWLHILSDIGVWAAYFVIPCVLLFYLLRRKGLPFRHIQFLFVAFILACGTTHLMEAIIFWWPAYRLAGLLKLVTALISWTTVFALVWITPRVLSLRSPEELEAEISERLKYEDALRQSEHDKEIAADKLLMSLKEKELLLKEVHHRVKNNLQIICALLDPQSSDTTDLRAHEMFRESQGRVRSMALIHERLYCSEELARVDFSGYVQQLADDLTRSYKVTSGIVKLDLEVTSPPLPIDTAVPCGLLLNELLSNCFKHAFEGRSEACIRVTLHPQPNDMNLLIVADDGIGFPHGVDLRTATSFGLQLVHTLVRQLAGTIEMRSAQKQGTEFRVTFPTNKK